MELPERGWVFSDGKGRGDWLGTNNVANQYKVICNFEEAREFVKSQPPETLGLMLFEGITPINIHFVRSLSEGKT